MAYIEKEPLCAWLENMGVSDLIIRRIKSEVHFPPADVVEVVRCKDCDVPHNKWTGCPYMNGLIPPPNHFCSYGKRRTDDDL